MTVPCRNVVAAVTLIAAVAFLAGMLTAHWQTWVYRQSLDLKRALIGSARTLQPWEQSHYQRRTSLFRTLNGSADVVMIGDSLTAQAEWSELLPRVRVHNRGILSDTVGGVDARLEQICKHRYRLAFLMIGINDVLAGMPAAQFEQTYSSVLDRLKRCTRTLVVHLLIVPGRAADIRIKANAFNQRIRHVAGALSIAVLDLNPVLAPAGVLTGRFTNDGVHLTGEGYAVWSSRLRAVIDKTL